MKRNIFYKRTLYGVAFVLFSLRSLSQTSSADSIFPIQHLRFSTDLIKATVNELQLIGEYRFSSFFSAGLCYGKVFRNTMYDPWFLSPSQQEWPGTAYHGDAYTVVLKFSPFRKKWRYIGLKGIYKSIWYSNQNFAEGTGYGHYISDNRSESARVVGFDLVYGKYRFLGYSRIPIEVFYGLGYRVRERNFTTYYATDDFGYRVPLQFFPNYFGYTPVHKHLEQKYVTFQFGVLIGFKARLRQRHPKG